ncbi:MAG: alpha-galactosidase [Caulobacteraceae bacterium]
MGPPGFALEGGGESLVFLTREPGAPHLVYWGPRLADPDAAVALADRPLAPAMLDAGETLSWLPEAGQGFTGHPAILGHREGRDLITRMEISGVVAATRSARVTMVDERAGVEVVLRLALDGATGVLTSRAAIRNTGAAPLTLEWLAAGAVPSPHAEIMSFGGRWAREFTTARQTLAGGLLVNENRTGRTSHHAPPFVIAGEAGFGEARGEVFAAHLAWSGNHRILAERLRDGRLQIQAGEALSPGEIVLGVGETYETPALYLARSDLGLNGLSDRLHPFVRDTVMGGRLRGKPRPVHCNTWEAVYFDHDPARLEALADQAAAVGAERFVLDDGWFAGRANDRAGLGDWWPDPVKYPRGLGPLIGHVRALGMSFGLWVEPEMVNADSDLFRAHPDWILGEPGRDQPLGRGQYVLDLTRPEVSETIFQQIDALLRAHPIAYLKWDMNRDLTHAVSDGRAAVHRQTMAVYALIDRVRAAHPAVEIESCASGGGRADYEILRRTDRIWTSDCNDSVERQHIQRAFSIFFPPEIMGAHVGPAKSHTTARTASMRFAAFTALVGHMGIEADLGALGERDTGRLAAAIAVHKRLRPWLHAARTRRLEHPDAGLLATAMIAGTRALILAAQVATPMSATPRPLRVSGLAPGAWTIREIDPPRRERRTAAGSGFLARGEPVATSAAALAHAGLPLPILHAGQIVAWEAEAVAPEGG